LQLSLDFASGWSRTSRGTPAAWVSLDGDIKGPALRVFVLCKESDFF